MVGEGWSLEIGEVSSESVKDRHGIGGSLVMIC